MYNDKVDGGMIRGFTAVSWQNYSLKKLALYEFEKVWLWHHSSPFPSAISPADLPPIYDDDDDDECLTCTCAFPSTSSAITTCQQLPPLFGRLVVQLRKEPTQQLGLGIAGE